MQLLDRHSLSCSLTTHAAGGVSLVPLVLVLLCYVTYLGMFRLLGTLPSSVSRTHIPVFWLRSIVLRFALTPTSCRLSTFESGRRHELSGYSDSDWAIKNSTSGWVIFWQNAPLVWGSRKQNCVALSSCEAEIIALSEAAKDMVYLRKFISGLTGKQPGGPSVLRTDNKAARDLGWRRKRGHDAPNTLAGVGCLTEIS